MRTVNKIGKNIIASIIIYCICGIIPYVYAEYELKTWLPQIEMGKSINVSLKYKNDTVSYRFKCLKSGIYYIDFSMELYGDSMAYSVGITDAYNNKVYPRIDRRTEGKFYIKLLENMDYYVTFNGEYDIYNYNFILDGMIEDDYENNESYSTDIKVGNRVSGKIQYYFDIDTFRFIPDKDGTYYINKTGNCNISLSHENETLTYYNKSSGSPSTYYNLKKGQEYYLKVTGYDISDYSIEVTGPLYIEDDFGNDKYSRKIIHAEKLISGEINYGGDVDQFIIDSESTEKYTFDFDGSDGIKASIHLFDDTLCTTFSEYFPVELLVPSMLI